MKKIQMYILACMVLSCLHAINLKANKADTIVILDRESGAPVAGVVFRYGEQKGISESDGKLRFKYRAGETMYLKRINYGEWKWSAEDIKELILSGVSYRSEKAISIFPVTILGLRKERLGSDNLELEYVDKMSHDAGAILNQSPAFNSIRKGGQYGFDPVFRGFKYDQLNIVIDGAQTATAACPNRMDPPVSQMASNMTDRIEIYKGPYSLRFGSAVGATINYAGDNLTLSEEPEVYGRLSGGYENNAAIYRSEGLLGFRGKKLELGMFGAWSEGSDYESGDNTKIPGDFTRGSFGAKLGYKPAQNHELGFSGVYNVSRDVDFASLPMDLREDDTWLLLAKHKVWLEKEYLKTWATSLYLSMVDHYMDNLLKDLEPRMVNAGTEAATVNYGGRTEGIWKYGNNTMYAGIDFRFEQAEGTRTRTMIAGMNVGNIMYDNVWQDGQIGKTGLFAEYRWQMERDLLVFSARMEMNYAEADDPDQIFETLQADSSIVQINPSFSMGYKRELNSHMNIGLWFARVQRSGSLTERYINYFPVGVDPFEIVGNPEVKPEVNYQTDATFNLETEHTVLRLDIFASFLQDYISSSIDTTLRPRMMTSPGVRRVVNRDKVFKTGFEFQFTQSLTQSLTYDFAAAFTWARNMDNNEPLSEIAPADFRNRLYGVFLDGKFSPEIQFRHVLAQNRISKSFGETRTPAFSTLDFKVNYSIKNSISLNAGVNNILDENYYEHLSRAMRGSGMPLYAPGMSVYAGFSLKF